LNPADLPSRGIAAKDLANNSTWWNGSEFLLHSETEWPEVTNPNSNELVLQEAVKNSPKITPSFVSVSVKNQFKKINQIINVGHYRDLTRLLRVTALVLKFIKRIKKRKVANTNNNELFNCEQLNSVELDKAEMTWIKVIQASSFTEEIEFLSRDRANNEHLSPPIYVTQFGLYFDKNGVIHCKGRINNSLLPENARNPILLPLKHKFVCLIIQQSHYSWSRIC
jgi:hypothetical protein